MPAAPSPAVLAEIAPGTELLLIRHGETAWNAEQRVQGNLDVPLSARGEAQARRLADWLRGEAITAAYTSDLSRSRRTAELVIGDRLPLVDDPRVREARFGAFEGLTHAEMAERYPAELAAWRADAVRHRPPGGETLEDLRDRCLAALADLLPRHPEGRVAVFAHGGPIRVMACGLLDLPLAFYPRLRVENTSVGRILFTSRGPMLAAWNDIAHLRGGVAEPGHSGWEEK
jgi:probable phosphoglycerate mutase